MLMPSLCRINLPAELFNLPAEQFNLLVELPNAGAGEGVGVGEGEGVGAGVGVGASICHGMRFLRVLRMRFLRLL